jgi:ribosomal protein L37AE/L43A
MSCQRARCATCRECAAPLLVREAVGCGLCAACDPDRSADELAECPVCGRVGLHDRIRRGICH